jgi:23S rRNA pseudouridine1911/1915/1917 synthase
MARKVVHPAQAESPSAGSSHSDELATELTAHEDSFEEVAQQAEASHIFHAAEEDAGVRLDHFLVARLPEVSRARVQQLIEQGKVLVNERSTPASQPQACREPRAAKASLKLKGREQIEVTGPVEVAPLKAVAEEIPLDVLYEDSELAVVNKPAGMVVHAAAGSAEDARNRGTLVNALLFRFRQLSDVGGELRPGIVHRLDKDTSGLMVVAKNDLAHRKLAAQFSSRQVHKIYLALVHNWPKAEQGSVTDAIGRDPRNRTRMSTSGIEARSAVSHYKVLERLLTPYGRFALVEVRIETGRTHQIRVHMASIGHPVVGDTLYGAPRLLLPNTLARERQGTAISSRVAARRARAKAGEGASGGPLEGDATLSLPRNFLHAARLSLTHPKSGRKLEFDAPLPEELASFLATLRQSAEALG